jgi:hypothetical protein
MKTKELETLKASIDGRELPFREYLYEISGSGGMYEIDIKKILKNWKVADYHYADEYIAPIASQVIMDCHELDKELYTKIMTLIEEAYKKLAPQVNPNEPNLTRIK